MKAWLPTLTALALAGCAKDDPKPRDTSALTPSVRFEADDSTFWSTPLPSDHRLVDGRVSLADFPNPDATPIVETVLEMLAPETGWGTTSGVFLPTDAPIDGASLPDVFGSLDPGASAFLVDVDPASPEQGTRIPVVATARTPVGPHDFEQGLVLLPVQGIPLRPNTRYAAVVTTSVRTTGGQPLVPSLAVRSLEDGAPDPVFGPAADAYQQAYDAVSAEGRVAGLAVFTTGDPVSPMLALVEAMKQHPMTLIDPPALIETYDDFCVYEGTLEVTSFQSGTPPFAAEGGGIVWVDGVPQPDHTEQGRFWVTIPRFQNQGAWPVAVMVRTGGGGDRPMIDRGRRDVFGEVIEPGEGPGRYFAQAAWAGFQYDGPLGGARNPGGGDEQFLVFNVTNPEALRDNLRQSAAELALIQGFVDDLSLNAADCPDTTANLIFRTEAMALLGHSMGATIAPLVLPAAPEYQHVVLSGAGGSWIENIVHKQSPLEVRPLAEGMLGYGPGTLTEDDPFLSLLQWAGESADPPVHGREARANPRDLLVFQGIVDTYILPPIANATNLGFFLDQGGFGLDAVDPRLEAYTPLAELQPLVGTTQRDLPITGNQDGRTAAVVQHIEDPIEDGHEVMFQLDIAKDQLRCFLDTARLTGVGEITNTCD